MKSPRFFLKNRDWLLITACWLITQIIAYSIYGINNKEESFTYISMADSFSAGFENYRLHHLWYAGYVAFLVVIRMLGLPYEMMYVVQLAASFASLVYFIRIVSFWLSSRLAIILSAMLYATCFILQQWVTHLFTDSIFTFLLIAAVYYLLMEDKSRHQKIVCWILLIILPFFRPVGFLFIVVACLHWLFSGGKKNMHKLVAASTYLVLLLLLIYRSLAVNAGYFYPFNNLDAEIICGLSSDLLQYQVVPYNDHTSVISYFWNNPEMTFRLFSLRLYKTFSLTRSYFSTGHNVVVAVSIIAYYSLALMGAFQIISKKLRDRYFLFAGVVIFSIPSVVFCVEWHGRMSLPILAFILLLGSIGIDRMVKTRFN